MAAQGLGAWLRLDRYRRVWLGLLLLLLPIAAPARAETPAPPAVVLSRLAELRFADPASGSASTLDVRVRTQILTPAGSSFGQVTVAHTTARPLELIEGRTVRSDGSSVPLPRDAIFVQDLGDGRAQTRAAFPAVEVGAIVELHFRLRWESVGPELWTLDGPLPTRVSELIFHGPAGSRVIPFVRGPSAGSVESTILADGRHGRVRAENLSAVVEEPYSLPLADLETRVVLVPQAHFDSWRTVCRRFEGTYERVRAGRQTVRRTAKRLTVGAGSPFERASILHAFVRDQIRSTQDGIATDPEATLDSVLEHGEGRHAEKALLLQALLEAAGVPARLVWAFDWRDGHADPEIVHPGGLARVLVLARLEDRELFLDPDDPGLAAGRLAPVQEGTRAIVVDREAPRIVELPVSPVETNQRTAEVELTLDAQGRLTGRGRLLLTGHHAWFYLGGRSTAEAAHDAWQRWLENAFQDFAIAEVEVREERAEQRLMLTWAMGEHAELVLGEEASLQPSRPLGPLTQRYLQAPESRRTPVHVSFPDVDTVILGLSWSEGWEIEPTPTDLELTSSAGKASAWIMMEAGERRLRYERRFEISASRYEPREAYAALRDLYAAMERHDAQRLVLVRRER